MQQTIEDLLKQGEAFYGEGNRADASLCFERILKLQPNQPEALNNLGVVACDEGELQLAVAFFRRVLELDAQHLEALENLARCCAASGDPAEAAALFERLRAIDPARPASRQAPADSGGRRTGSATSSKRRRIGFVTIWFERGQSYVTKMLRDVLAAKHDTFVFARTGGVHGVPKLETSGVWKVDQLTSFGAYEIPHDVLGRWIMENDLDLIVFNEEYDWSLVQFCKQRGVQVATYLDYYKDEWKPLMPLYDLVLCSTRRAHHLVAAAGNAQFVGWAVDTELFRPRDTNQPRHTFFHNAGWLGVNYRKMTPAAILAFDAVSRHYPDLSLFVHAQCALEKLPGQVVEIVRANPRITYHAETVPAPGLYHQGQVLLFPTKLEGLGLPLLEGLACGLPAVVTDAPPMNEFIQDGYNGLLVRVAHRFTRDDHIAFPEEVIDVNELAVKMAMLARRPAWIHELARNARTSAETQLHLEAFSARLMAAIDSL